MILIVCLHMFFCFVIFFFFKQKTAYEMRISDWSSDVCSSDLNPVYYVQYAHARICRVFEQLAAKGGRWDAKAANDALHRLDNDNEKTLLSLLGRYPDMLRRAAATSTPHTVLAYTTDPPPGLTTYHPVQRVPGQAPAALTNHTQDT